MALRSRLIRLAHQNPELREHLLPLLGQDKQASAAVVRKTITMIVRVRHAGPSRYNPGMLDVSGAIDLDFGGDAPADTVLFTCVVEPATYHVMSIMPTRSVSGGGAEMLIGILKAAVQEAFDQKGAQLIG